MSRRTLPAIDLPRATVAATFTPSPRPGPAEPSPYATLRRIRLPLAEPTLGQRFVDGAIDVALLLGRLVYVVLVTALEVLFFGLRFTRWSLL